MCDGNWDAIVGLLLRWLPNLQQITMESYPCEESNYIDLSLNTVAKYQNLDLERSTFLKHLKSVSLAYRDTESGMSIDKVIPFTTSQSVSRADFHMISDECFEDKPDRLEGLSLSSKT
jgi:hypothetical protein